MPGSGLISRAAQAAFIHVKPSTTPMLTFHVARCGLGLALAATPLAAITVSQFNVTLTEDFDTLALVTSSVLPAGWELHETGSGANTTYGAGTGSSSTGNTYSFGGSSSTDRALGTLRTSSVIASVGTMLTNDTGAVITELTLQYTGEQWRLGATGRTDQLDFSYSLDATSLATGAWTDIDALDFLSPTTSGATGALDGNLSDNQALISHTITGLSLAPGASLWFRWSDVEASGSDDGLAIDNLSVTAGTAVSQHVPDALPSLGIAFVLGTLVLFAAGRRTSSALLSPAS